MRFSSSWGVSLLLVGALARAASPKYAVAHIQRIRERCSSGHCAPGQEWPALLLRLRGGGDRPEAQRSDRGADSRSEQIFRPRVLEDELGGESVYATRDSMQFESTLPVIFSKHRSSLLMYGRCADNRGYFCSGKTKMCNLLIFIRSFGKNATFRCRYQVVCMRSLYVFRCICICICVCVKKVAHRYTSIQMCAYFRDDSYVCTFACVPTCTHAHTCMQACACMCMHIGVCFSARAHAGSCVYEKREYVHAYRRTCILAYITFTNACTSMQTCTL